MDLLSKIRHAKTREKMALYVRAFGCSVAPMLLNTYRHEEAARAITEYEYLARSIEKNCETIEQARRVAREAGF